MDEPKTSRNEEGAFEPFACSDVPWTEFSKGSKFGLRYKHLSSFGGGSKVGVALEEIEPGKQGAPFHYHLREEEHLFILSGELTLRLGSKRYRMKAGDFVCFPAGQQVGHAIINESEKTCRYLIIGENDPDEVCVYPDSGRVSVRRLGEGYRKSETMDYWEGEDIG
ncbi:cupin domain-containing protein [Hyphobacterium marinum]|uniref:Cupin domain-containing protein n=1 Tax=Hyphobacterium marinum TaxID=3116574 RepID=A0ABU7M1F6_9PROT|nr:cupin domain-containing protein [Hyphobacterium sp. Y6023]MEE2567605.1 cupin domain-containing protein [Hyphobacterium sp. Y6023]